MIRTQAGFAAMACMVALQGCTLSSEEDVDRFRSALPAPEEVEVAGPDPVAVDPGATEAQAESPWEGGPYAESYAFTRHVRDGVNWVTGQILGSLWLIVHTPPTSVTTDEAVWGPHADALEPAAWQLRVREIEPDTFEYVLEGKPKNTSLPFRAVLSGHAYGPGHPLHGDGSFSIDLDTARDLDPMANADSSGVVRIMHDLPATLREAPWIGERAVTAEVQPSDGQAQWTAESIRQADGGGRLRVVAWGDVDDDPMTAEARVEVDSQYLASGAGRATMTVSGGDLPPELGPITAVECWGPDFFRSYYTDSVGHAPTEGDAAACIDVVGIEP